MFFSDTTQTTFNWEYACFDMLAPLMSHHAGSGDFRIKRIQVEKEGEGDVYIDEVSLGREATVQDTS